MIKQNLTFNVMILTIILVQATTAHLEKMETSLLTCFTTFSKDKTFNTINDLYNYYGTKYNGLDKGLKSDLGYITLKRELTGTDFYLASSQTNGEGTRDIGKTMSEADRIARNSKDLFQLIGTANLLGIFKAGEELPAYHLQTVCRSLATMKIAMEIYFNTHEDSANYGEKEAALIMFAALSSDVALPNALEKYENLTSDYFTNFINNWNLFGLKFKTNSTLLLGFKTMLEDFSNKLIVNEWPQMFQVTFSVSSMIYELIFFKNLQGDDLNLFTLNLGTMFDSVSTKSFNVSFTKELGKITLSKGYSADDVYVKLAENYHKYPERVVSLANMMCMTFKNNQLKAYMIGTLLKLKMVEAFTLAYNNSSPRHNIRVQLINALTDPNLGNLVGYYSNFALYGILTEDRIYSNSSIATINLMKAINAKSIYKKSGKTENEIIASLVNRENAVISPYKAVPLPTLRILKMDYWYGNAQNFNPQAVINKIPQKYQNDINSFFAVDEEILLI